MITLRWKNTLAFPYSLLHCILRCYSISTLQTHPRPFDEYCYIDFTPKIRELCKLGKVNEARNLFDTMPHKGSFTWNCMIFGYAQNGQMDSARALFDAFAFKNTRTWTILVSGYSKIGNLEEAHLLFNKMPVRNVVAWNALISGYVQNGNIKQARRLFDEMPSRDVASWNAIVTGYCHVHEMAEALRLFNKMHVRDLVSWTVMISGYVQVNEYGDAWRIFLRMYQSEEKPDQSNFTVAVSAISGLGSLRLLENLRTLAIKTDFERDVVVGTAILNAYTKDNRGLDEAERFFRFMHERNEYSWSIMIAAFTRAGRLDDALSIYENDPAKSLASQTTMLTGFSVNGRIHEAKDIFEKIQNPSVVSWNAMIAGYMQNNMLDEAKALFHKMPFWNAISWATMISGCAQNGEYEDALHIFLELHRSGTLPNLSSFTSGFFACGNIGALEMGRQLHSLSFKAGAHFNPYVSNSLITMYAKCKHVEAMSQVFGFMRRRDTISWNSLIAALSQNNMLEDARIAFDKMGKRDVVSWTAMISAYSQVDNGNEAIKLFVRMLGEEQLPNSLTFTSVLSSCANLGDIKFGRQLHSFIIKLGYDLELFIGNALITMYFKCGCTDSLQVFNEMVERDIVTWNSVLAGCAQHGFSREALEIFEQMKSEGILPNQVTFLLLLCACSHGGLVAEGWQYFKSMSRDYSIVPLKEHYASVVDLLGRSGHLDEAENFIKKMPIEPDTVVWSALLGACRIHQNVEIGRRVAYRLFDMDPQNSGNFVLLSNIYASLEMWDEVDEVRKLMRDHGVVMRPGFSWSEMKKKVNLLINDNNQHEQVEMIYGTLKEFHSRKKAPRNDLDMTLLLDDVRKEQESSFLSYI